MTSSQLVRGIQVFLRDYQPSASKEKIQQTSTDLARLFDLYTEAKVNSAIEKKLSELNINQK